MISSNRCTPNPPPVDPAIPPMARISRATALIPDVKSQLILTYPVVLNREAAVKKAFLSSVTAAKLVSNFHQKIQVERISTVKYSRSSLFFLMLVNFRFQIHHKIPKLSPPTNIPIVATHSIAGESKEPIDKARVLSPPVDDVVKEWQMASNPPIPATQ